MSKEIIEQLENASGELALDPGRFAPDLLIPIIEALKKEEERLSEAITFDPDDPEIRWILGQPCFMGAPIVEILRLDGHDIPRRAEHEQAAFIIWAIRKYQQHGACWKADADKELREIKKLNRPFPTLTEETPS